MQICQNKSSQKCSVKGCDHLTTNFFESKKQKIYLCEGCLTALMEGALQNRVPKSPKNTIKKILDKKREENYV